MKTYYIAIVLILTIFSGCKKQEDWLDVKAKNSEVTLSTFRDLQALLDNTSTFNTISGLSILATDNLTMTYENWQSAYIDYEQKAYVFKDKVFDDPTRAGDVWSDAYAQISSSNNALEVLAKISTTKAESDAIKGGALFFRGLRFFALAQYFTKPYQKASENTDLGIPLRLNASVTEKSVRATMKQTYEQIISDLKQAEELLPVTPSMQTRSSKAAAQAALARVYLVMGEYEKALEYANKALAIKSDIIDFNTLDAAAMMPLSAYPDNKEVILYQKSVAYSLTLAFSAVDPSLYQSYTDDDLRKAVFFMDGGNGAFVFKGQYTGNFYWFSGLATNELYLIRAEANARLDHVGPAMTALNALMIKRWKIGSFEPFEADNKNEALKIILAERRKELPFSGNTRWEDLRRLNADPDFAVTVVHTLNGVNYTLAPGSSKYVFDIPFYETKLSGIQQNER